MTENMMDDLDEADPPVEENDSTQSNNI